jgi:hypothetical protein
MVFKTVNRFSKLNFSSLHARLIFDCQNLAIVNRQNSGGTGIRQHPATVIGCRQTKFRPKFGNGQKPARSGQNGRNQAESDQIRPLIRPNLAKMARIRPGLDGSGQTCSPESDNDFIEKNLR